VVETCTVFVIGTLCSLEVLLVPFDTELAVDELLIPTLDPAPLVPIGAVLGFDGSDEGVITALGPLTALGVMGALGALGVAPFPSSNVYIAESNNNNDELWASATNVCASLLRPSDTSIGTE